MKKRILQILMAMALLAATAVAAFADGQVVITGGSLSQIPQNIGFTATLTGLAQTVNDNDSTNWTATDPTGTGTGWNITILATDFVSGGNTIAVSNFKVKLDAGNIATVDGNTAPTSSITAYTSLTGTAQKLLSAAVNAGMGDYTYVPDFSLDLAADVFAGTYDSTVTVAVVSGP